MVVIGGVEQKAHFFVMDLPHSDACFVRAYPAATAEAWVDGHVHAFAFFGNATGIVDQPKLPRFKAYTNYDNYVGVGTWTKIGLNNTDYNDQGAFDAANNRFVAPGDGTYLFGATLLYMVNASTAARMRGRPVLNGTTEIRGSFGEISGAHVSEATALWLQTMVALTAGDTVELQGSFARKMGISRRIRPRSGAARSGEFPN